MRSPVFSLALCLSCVACSGDDASTTEPPADAQVEVADTSSVDSGALDTGVLDTGVLDAGKDASDTAAAEASETGAEPLEAAVDAPDASDATLIDASVIDTLAETTVADTAPADTAPADTGCGGTVSTTTTDLYVDKASTLPSVGNAACPFHTVREATELAWTGTGTRTVRVKAATYTESGIVRVRARVALVGEGPSTTKLTGGSATSYCSGPPVGSSTPCMVYVEAGASVDGFTVQFTASTTAGDGLVLGNEAGSAPIVKNVTTTGAPRMGIFTLGAAELGPNLHADKNGGSGVSSTGASVRVHVIGTTNSFDGNAFGFGVLGAAYLDFEGGSASNNSVHGLALSGPTGSQKHNVKSLIAKGNAYVGVSVSSQASLTLRDSVVLKNGDGLRFYYGSTNKLDIGTATSAGNNVFNAPTSDANLHVGVCLSSAPGAGLQAANGNKWTACPVVQTAIAACDGTGPARDAAYAPTTAGPSPLVTTGCTVGP